MITKKHLLVAILATCLLTMFVITIVPIRSSPGVGDYNARLDTNGDGVIDGSDLASAARAYGTAGDPTLPVVTIANTSQNTYYTTINGLSSWMFYANTAGYRQVTVIFDGTYPTFVNYYYNVYIGFMTLFPNSTYQVDSCQALAYASSLPIPPNPPNVWNYTARTIAVTGSQIWICVYNPTPGAILTEWMSIYMTA